MLATSSFRLEEAVRQSIAKLTHLEKSILNYFLFNGDAQIKIENCAKHNPAVFNVKINIFTPSTSAMSDYNRMCTLLMIFIAVNNYFRYELFNTAIKNK